VPTEDISLLNKRAKSVDIGGGAGQSGRASLHAGDLLAQSEHGEDAMGHKLPRGLRLQMARDCAAGVAFLHERHLMHCKRYDTIS
jgi:hypothetical protein